MARIGDKRSALVVTASPKTFSAIRMMLQDRVSRIQCASSSAQARQMLGSWQPEVVLINTPLPDDFGVETAIDIVRHFPAVGVLVLIKAEMYEHAVYRTKNTGIFLLARPIEGAVMIQAVETLFSMQERLAAYELENRKLRRRLEELGIVTRAKCLLIEKRHLTEAEAHYRLEQLAMESGISKKEVAQRLIGELTGPEEN